MEKVRKPYQGVTNIIRFNWHFYVIALVFVLLALYVSKYLNFPNNLIIYLLCIAIGTSLLISLFVSYYVYDVSGLYKLNWFSPQYDEELVINIHAGFDETSSIIQSKYKSTKIVVLDFYDPKKHTEVSIKRARKLYPSFPNTKKITTSKIDHANNSVDNIFIILSAHEIRDQSERIDFFKELQRIIKPYGTIYLTEHLRDLPNFLAYTIGAFHFYSKKNWRNTIEKSGLIIQNEIKNTAFISTFIIQKNGITS